MDLIYFFLDITWVEAEILGLKKEHMKIILTLIF